ncbi:histidinol-phosphate transaminase [Rhodovibrionaceae bacterium A322]
MMALTPRPGIMDIAAYVGGDSKVEGVERVYRLASNENPLGCSAKAAEAYHGLAGELHRYPDGGATALRRTLAEQYSLEADRIVCGAGSDELISLLVRAYAGPGDEVLYSQHGFLMYPISAKSVGATPVSAPESNLTTNVDSLLAAVSENTKICFVANPNNPTGSYISAAELERLRAGLRDDILLVVDAAYAEYVEAEDYGNGQALVEAHDNVVMTRTFSKIYGLGSVRLGWAYCSAQVADVLNRIRGPFNVPAPAQAAGVAAVKDQDFVDQSRQHNNRMMAWFKEQCARFNLRVEPSVGNFVIVRFADAQKALAHFKSRGVLVRAMGGYGLPDYLRITLGTDEEMQAVVSALEELEQ